MQTNRVIQLFLIVIQYGWIQHAVSTTNENNSHELYSGRAVSSTSSLLRRLDDNDANTNDDEITDENDYTFLDGSVVTRTDVRGYANLALDLRDIRKYSRNKNYTSLLRALYMDGLHSVMESTSTRKFSLKYLSDDLANTVNGTVTISDKSVLTSIIATPMYLFQLNGLSSRQQGTAQTSISSVASYAYELIEKTIVTNIAAVPDAILVHSFWMYATHILFHGMHVCSLRANADDPNFVSWKSLGMDEFIAMWIGSNQRVGTTDGHSLYAWTQEIGIMFGTADETTEAYANTQLKLLYQEGAEALALSSACSKQTSASGGSYSSIPTESEKHLWHVIVRMMQQMMVPLFQWTIFHLIEEDTVALKIYARALIPQLSRCRPSVYNRLYDSLLGPGGSNTIDYTLKRDILNDLIDMYSNCFGLRCQDIGYYEDDNFQPECGFKAEGDSLQDDTVGLELPPPVLAGYTSSTSITELARIDLDVYQIKLLTRMGAYDYARYMYQLGFNVPIQQETFFDPYDLISLQYLATGHDTGGSLETGDINKYYTAYLNYFDDREYMNKQTLQALDPNHDSGTISTPSQRSTFVGYMLSTNILFLKIVTLLENTVWACANKLDSVEELDVLTLYDMTHPLDEVAAFYIGSMEGSAMGGSADVTDEQLLYGLTNAHAFQFQRENGLSYAIANADFVNEMYAAKGLLSTLSCSDLKNNVGHIIRLTQIGILQSIIYVAVARTSTSATSTSDTSMLNSNNDELAIQGHVLTLAILPALASFDKSKAKVLADNMLNGAPIKDGAQVIADIIAQYLYRSLGSSCKYLGSYGNVKPCKNAKETGGTSGIVLPSRHYVRILLAFVTICTTILFVA